MDYIRGQQDPGEPQEDSAEQDNERSRERLAALKRTQTMPVKSVLPDNVKFINFDEIESCRISGMSSEP